MFTINNDKSIHLTRGDIAFIEVTANTVDDTPYIFQAGDVVRFTICEKNKCDAIVLRKDFVVDSETSIVEVYLSSEDTRIGALIHKPNDYWYEVELNPETMPQTIIGYDASGPKIFRLYPEGDDD